jgi:hypothetical protein
MELEHGMDQANAVEIAPDELFEVTSTHDRSVCLQLALLMLPGSRSYRSNRSWTSQLAR